MSLNIVRRSNHPQAPSPTLVLLSLVLLSLLLTGGAWAQASSTTVTVRVDSTVDLGAGLSPARELDYGSYRWLELPATDYDQLVARGVPHTLVEDAGQVRITRWAFDPLDGGEPVLDPAWTAVSSGARLRLVQLVAPTRDGWLRDLTASGAEVLQYYPHHTYLVWADDLQAAALEPLEFVRWQGVVHPAYKLGPQVAFEDAGFGAVVVFAVPAEGPQPTLDALAQEGALISHRSAQPDGALHQAVVALDGDPGALLRIAHLEEVLWVGRSSEGIQLEDEMSSQIVAGNHPGDVPVTGYFAHLAGLGFDGSGVIWQVADTGIDYDHPDLGSRIVGGFSVPGTTCNTPPGSDCAGGGHGTHVAGIVGGDATGAHTDGDNFLYGLGVAPGVSFFALNIFGSGIDLPSFSQQAVLGGAVGSNNSWTTGEGTAHGYQNSERTYDFMVRDGDFDTVQNEPHVVVFSAGNSGPGSMTLTAPKEAKNVIVTAGTQNYRTSSNIDAMYVFSSRGPAVDGRTVPTIAAPGQTIASSRNDLGGACASAIGGTDGLYAFCTGTSMAAPQTSGALALASEWWRSENVGDDFSPAMAKALLVVSAVPITSTPDVPNFDDGWGRIQATEMIAPTANRVYVDQQHTFEDSGETWMLETAVANPIAPLKISLAWTDAPGAIGANPALVNDLDLEVTVGGVTYLGNVFSAGASVAGGTADTINNLENVFLSGVSGPVTVTVRATNVVGDGIPDQGDLTDQDFALICHNCEDVLDAGIFGDGFESGDVSAWSSSVP